MSFLRHIFLSASLAFALAFSASAQGNVSVKAELDSAQLLMGKVTTLNIKLLKPASLKGNLIIPTDSMAANVEIVGEGKADTAQVGNGMEEINRRLKIQSFDSGLYMLKPILFVSDKGDTVASGRPVLKVNPVAVDSLKTIHDYADVQDGEHHFWDWLPDFITDWGVWILIALIVVVGGIILYMKYLRKGKLPVIQRKKEEPPYELAVRQLNELKDRHLCETGREKEYYTNLTDILRNYIDSRFHINAMEMTSTQILKALESNENTRLPRKHMAQVLEVADFVKFAGQRPLPDDNVKAFNDAMQFVEDTKPTPEEPSVAADLKPGDALNQNKPDSQSTKA